MQNLNNLNNLSALGIKGNNIFNPASIIDSSGNKLLLQQFLTKQVPTINGVVYDERTNKGTARSIQVGRAYLFDGTNDYVALPIGLDCALSGATIRVRGYINYSIDGRAIFGKGGNVSSGEGGYVIYITSGKIGIGLYQATSTSLYRTYTGSSTLSAGTNYYIDATFTESTCTISINGVADTVTIGSSTGTYGDATSVIPTIGARSAGAQSQFGGKIWGLEIFKNSVLKGFYKCDEQSGTTSYDSSGNAYHATITNATLATFHSTQDVYSYQNEVGYSKPSTVFIPRNEAIPTQDVTGSALQYTGQVPYNALLKSSSCILLDGTNDYVDLPDIGTINKFEAYVKFAVDDQELFTLDNTTGTSLKVSAGTLTTGAGLTISSIKVDDVTKTASEAGALLNDNTWHKLEVNFTSAVATTDLRLGTDSSAYGNIYMNWWKFSNSSTVRAVYHFAEGVGVLVYDSSGNSKHGVLINGATWSTQDNYHNNIVNGYSSFTNLNSGYTYTVGTPFDVYKIETEFILPSDFDKTSTNTLIINLNTTSGVGELRLGSATALATDEAITLRGGTTSAVFYVSNITITKGYHKFKAIWNGTTYDLYIDDVMQTTSYANSSIISCDLVGVYGGGIRNFKVYGQSNVLKINIGFTNASDYIDTVGTAVNATASGSTVRIPALNATTDVFNLALTNPAGAYHNGAETLIDMTGGVASPVAVLYSWGTTWSFNTARVNPKFKRTITLSGIDHRADRFLAYRGTLTGTNLSKVNKYVTTKAI